MNKEGHLNDGGGARGRRESDQKNVKKKSHATVCHQS
jgi:hypothetical protein